MIFSLRYFLILLLGVGLYLFIQGCKNDSTHTKSPSKLVYKDQTELWVFKVENVRLRESIRKEAKFSNVSFKGGDHDYYITLVAQGDNQESATQLMKEVTEFALDWGAKPENQVWHHEDDGFDEEGNRKYKRTIVNSVSFPTVGKHKN